METGEEHQLNLCKAIERVSCLLSLSHSVKVFHVKWQSIRTKLEELHSTLTCAQNCDFTEISKSSFWGLTKSILATVDECYDLVNPCVNLSYSGKLLMQSDLDVIFSKLELHLKRLAEIFDSGVLSQTHMIVVSKPSVGATRDDVNFYIMDLLTRLRIGDSVMKAQALLALNQLVQEDGRCVKLVVEAKDLIALLISFLGTEDQRVQEESLEVVSAIADFPCYRSALVGAGIVSPLIQVLERASEVGKERAAIALQKLTENANNAWSISAQGGVTALIRICSASDSSRKLVCASCEILKNLVGVEEIKRFLVEDGVIPIFVGIMNSKNEASIINAIQFLQVMASGDESTRQMVIREGGIYALVQILDPKAFFSSKAVEVTLRGIETLCFSSRTCLITLLSYGFLDRLHCYLHSHEVSVQEVAVKTTFLLCNTSEDIKKAMGDKDFMSELVQLLNARRSLQIQEMAAEALASLLCIQRNMRKFVHDNNNVGTILQLLEPEEGRASNKTYLLSVILSLTNCHSGRRKVLNSAYVKIIEKLAQEGVTDAKKITKKLSTNRFKSALSMIWNS
ncbi:hypothetical protein ACHQM5_025707 [Ranunculus cassubicifolius]